MAVKNYWSFEPGETIVAEELMKHCKDYDFYFPLRDTGIDVLGVHKKTKNVITFQVKESRYYQDKNHSWHQESKKNIEQNKNRCDFYIFVTYISNQLYSKQEKPSFKTEFIIVPMKDLIKKLEVKSFNKVGKYSFYFSFFNEHDEILEIREKRESRNKNLKYFNYTKYRNNWNLIK